MPKSNKKMLISVHFIKKGSNRVLHKKKLFLLDTF